MKSNATWAPLHRGEVAVQKRLGVVDEVNQWAPHAIRPFMPEQHRLFFQQLPFMVVAARDSSGAPWATMLFGSPGFVQSPDSRHLKVQSMPLRGDALESSFVEGAEIGMLGIELETRRRNRANGKLKDSDKQGFTIAVDQSFGNCPQYISKRTWHKGGNTPTEIKISQHTQLDSMMKSWITGADTLFIASGYSKVDQVNNSSGMDVSHRGGPPGFVKIKSDTDLVLPDFSGNNLFNTIGNLVVDSRVGLVFVDFKHGSLLQLTGNAQIDWDSSEVAKHSGAQRLINVAIDRIVVLEHSTPLRWDESEGAVRELRLVDRIIESDDVTSFVFSPRDQGRLPVHSAGQYLPIEMKLNGKETIERTYTLSNHPEEKKYRISVKRESKGLVSRQLHDNLLPGDIILARDPEGEFVLSAGNNHPVALISAGIGITPMVSMLNVLAKQARQVYFIHGARNGRHNPLAKEVTALTQIRANIHLFTLYSQPLAQDIEGVDYHQSGRINARVIEDIVPGLNAEFYICGPKAFLAEIATFLTESGVVEKNIRIESFS